ncbi:MAG TPA: aminotransferase class III-fold pyridoxal phosphate-dependent enzyme, partial [Thermoanaerobaculia bacterium]|nr:aminotransferase class III-fold pyridoxal phosphate-dependent enzyme [Thermoanaerobaculia bacterium]
LFDVEPDLTTLGKVIGGGFPLAAYGGRRDLMERIAPAGPVYQAGTLSGNPIAVAAGNETLRLLAVDDPCPYEALEASSSRLAAGIGEAASKHGVPCQVQRQGSMLGVFLSPRPVRSLADVDASDREGFARLFHLLLERGVHLPPSPYETLFVSLAHGEGEIDETIAAFDDAFAQL